MRIRMSVAPRGGERGRPRGGRPQAAPPGARRIPRRVGGRARRLYRRRTGGDGQEAWLAVAAGKQGSPVNALVLDAGALVAIDRDDRDVHKMVRDAHRMGVQVLTNSMAVAQVWRDSK